MTCKEILSMLVWYQEKTKELVGPVDVTISSEYSFITITGPGIDMRLDLSTYQNENSSELPWSSDIIQQIESADNIASLAVNCTKGDDYHPGNFSKVLLAANHIELQQVNYMNAKSLDHKKDYNLRSLVFRIALTGGKKMITEFTDRSSQNNRECGDKIKAALDWTA